MSTLPSYYFNLRIHIILNASIKIIAYQFSIPSLVLKLSCRDSSKYKPRFFSKL
jgi:hypothetical protein